MSDFDEIADKVMAFVSGDDVSSEICGSFVDLMRAFLVGVPF